MAPNARTVDHPASSVTVELAMNFQGSLADNGRCILKVPNMTLLAISGKTLVCGLSSFELDSMKNKHPMPSKQKGYTPGPP
jgi:hypothetical protein